MKYILLLIAGIVLAPIASEAQVGPFTPSQNPCSPSPASVTLTLPASPGTLFNTAGVPEYVTLTAGTVTVVTVTRGAFTSGTLFAATPATLFLSPGDSFTVTYTVAPTVTALPVGFNGPCGGVGGTGE